MIFDILELKYGLVQYQPGFRIRIDLKWIRISILKNSLILISGICKIQYKVLLSPDASEAEGIDILHDQISPGQAEHSKFLVGKKC